MQFCWYLVMSPGWSSPRQSPPPRNPCILICSSVQLLLRLIFLLKISTSIIINLWKTTIFSNSVVPTTKNFLSTCICQALPMKKLHILKGIRNSLIFKVVYNLMRKNVQTVTNSDPAAAKQEYKWVKQVKWRGGKLHSTWLASYSKFQKNLEVQPFIWNLL